MIVAMFERNPAYVTHIACQFAKSHKVVGERIPYNSFRLQELYMWSHVAGGRNANYFLEEAEY